MRWDKGRLRPVNDAMRIERNTGGKEHLLASECSIESCEFVSRRGCVGKLTRFTQTHYDHESDSAMNSGDSEYSDVEHSDLDDELAGKSSRSKKSKKSAHGGYRIRNALKVPRATTYTAQALYGAYLNRVAVERNHSAHTSICRPDPQFGYRPRSRVSTR